MQHFMYVVQASPVCLYAECSSSTVSLQWQAPLCDNGSAVTSYSVEHASSGAALRHQHTWHKAYNGKDRHYQVRQWEALKHL